MPAPASPIGKLNLPPPGPTRSRWTGAIALWLSVLAHGLLLRALTLPAGHREAPVVSAVPLTLRLESRTARAPAPTPTPAPERHSEAPQVVPPPPAAPAPTPPSAAPGQPRPSGYFSLSELSSKPRFVRYLREVNAIDIPNPPRTPTVVHIYINENGTVDQVTLEDNGLSELARQWTIERFRAMQFSPGMLDGMPVKSQLQTEFNVEDAPDSMPLAR